jgi:hypothetical protein
MQVYMEDSAVCDSLLPHNHPQQHHHWHHQQQQQEQQQQQLINPKNGILE